MIRTLEINNIQSHKKSKLEFSNGVNVIVGASNQGKSAILRALYWVRYNRPLGIDTLASHWIVNDKGNLTGNMSVTLTNDFGVVERRRTKDENQYVVDGNELNVVKTDVPPQVENMLKLSDTNVQKQLDAPFLLSQTSGEVAKYFNNIVNLDIIDKVLSNAETKRRRTKHDIEATKDKVAELESSMKDYEWIDEVESLINDYDKLEERLLVITTSLENIDNSLTSYNRCCESIESNSIYIDEPKKLVERCESIINSINLLSEDINYIERSVDDYESNDITLYIKSIENAEDVSRIDELRNRYNDLSKEISTIDETLLTINHLEFYDMGYAKKCLHKLEILSDDRLDDEVARIVRDLENYDRCESIIDENLEKIYKLNKSMPKICPICGHPLKENCHE